MLISMETGCVYTCTPMPWLVGNRLKIGQQYQVKQYLVSELWNYISSYVSPWTNSISHRKPLPGIVRFGPLRRVSELTLIQGNIWKELSMNHGFTYENKLSSPYIYEQQYQGPQKTSIAVYCQAGVLILSVCMWTWDNNKNGTITKGDRR